MTDTGRDIVRPLPFSDRPRLTFSADAIAVQVAPVEPDGVPRLVVEGWGADNLDIAVDARDDQVRVRVSHRRTMRLYGGDGYIVRLFVPRTVHAAIESSAGAIDIADLGPCNLEVEADAGRIRLRRVYGRLTLSSDAGTIRGEDVGGHFGVETDTGKVELHITGIEPGEHYVRTDIGAIHIEIARGLPVQVEARAAIGTVRNRYPSSPAASARLRVSTEVGAIRVQESDRSPVISVEDARAEPVVRIPVTPRTAAAAPPDVDGGESIPSSDDAAPAGAASELERVLRMVERGEMSAHEANEVLRTLDRR